VTVRWVDRAALALAVVFLLAAVVLGLVWTGTAGATSTPLLQQVRSQWRCLVTKEGKPQFHVCGARYADAFLAVNARRETYPVAVGIHRAAHQPIERCRCQAGQVLHKAQVVARYRRRRFNHWWKKPGTPAGDKLKGCLKNAAAAFGAAYAVYASSGGKTWNDDEVAWSVAIACGIGVVTE
jgi:hypothetical protein